MNKYFYLLILFFCGLTANAQMNHSYQHDVLGELKFSVSHHSPQESVSICFYQDMIENKLSSAIYQNKTYYFCSPIHLKMFKKNPGFYASKVKTIAVEARQFKFTPSILTVNQGDIVQIVLTSADVTHGFYLKDFKVNTTITKGEKKFIEFVADKKGAFPFLCSVYCGIGHHEMNGVFNVK